MKCVHSARLAFVITLINAIVLGYVQNEKERPKRGRCTSQNQPIGKYLIRHSEQYIPYYKTYMG